MSKLLIEGFSKLSGEVNIHGAKNSVLPILAATILCGDVCVLHNCPLLSDVDVSIKILRYLGAKVKRENSTLIVDSRDINRYDIPDGLMREMRSSVVFLGSLVSRMNRASISFPGGCELGPRPIDLHLDSLKQLGMKIEECRGSLECTVDKKFNGGKISLSFPSVGATENILLAAAISEGVTVITNAAREPEIYDLIDFLNSCGAKISGTDENLIIIEGVKTLHGTEHFVIPDRISAATFMSAAAITRGDVVVKNIVKEHMTAVFQTFEELGCELDNGENYVRVTVPNNGLNAIKFVKTMPYPGFPTDMQAILMAVLSIANGTSMLVENIFDSRYKHVDELIRLGANIKVEGRVAVVEGVKKLYGSIVEGKDLRGTAALVVAGLVADGQTEVTGINFLDRGYESFEKNLSYLGAKIKRI